MIGRAVLLTLVLAAPASAQGVLLGDFGTLGRPVGTLSAPVRVQGDLTVAFAADPATCATYGRCGERGTIAYRPARAQRASVLDLRRGRTRTLLPLYLSGEDDEGETFAQVRRPRADGQTGVCTTTTFAAGGLGIDVGADGRATVGVGQGGQGPLATSCGGPLWTDVKAAVPMVRLARGAVARGFTADLRGTTAVTAGGLTLTVRSTLVVRVGRPVRDDERSGIGDTLGGTYPGAQRWRVTRVTGAVRMATRATERTSACTVLDVCGLAAQTTLTPQPRLADAEVIVVRDGRRIAGSGGWVERGGLRTSVTREASVAPCEDGAPLLAGLLELGGAGDTLRVGYSAPFARSRCAGPDLPSEVLALGTVKRSALRGRTVALRLDQGRTTSAGGLRSTTTSDLVVELTRRSGG